MSEPRYFRLLYTLAAAGHAPAGPGTASLEEIGADAFKRARKAMKALPQDPTDDELHAVRIETSARVTPPSSPSQCSARPEPASSAVRRSSRT